MNTFEKILATVAVIGTVAVAVDAAEESNKKYIELQRKFSRTKSTSYYPSEFEIDTFKRWCEINGYTPVEEVAYGRVVIIKAGRNVLIY